MSQTIGGGCGIERPTTRCCPHARPDMAYCTPDDVIDAYSATQVAQATGDSEGDTVDTERLTKAVEDYGAHIEMHVRMQHPDNPFGTDHEFLQQINVEGAFLLLQKRGPMGLSERQQDAEKRLDTVLLRISEGKVVLQNDEAQSTADSRPSLNAEDMVQTSRRLFGRRAACRDDPHDPYEPL